MMFFCSPHNLENKDECSFFQSSIQFLKKHIQCLTDNLSLSLSLSLSLIIYIVFLCINSISGEYLLKNQSSSSPTIVTKSFQIIDASHLNTKIVLDFRRNKMLGDYDNLFSTAPYNDGIRIEFNGEHSWAIILPTKDGVKGYSLGILPRYGEWTHLEIFLNNGKLQVYNNNALVLEENEIDFAYKINEISLGIGFSPDRPFDGDIKNFTLTIFDSSTWLMKATQIIEGICVLLLLCHIIYNFWYFLFIRQSSLSGRLKFLLSSCSFLVVLTLLLNRLSGTEINSFLLNSRSIIIIGSVFTSVLYLSKVSSIFRIGLNLFSLSFVYVLSYIIPLNIPLAGSFFTIVLSILLLGACFLKNCKGLKHKVLLVGLTLFHSLILTVVLIVAFYLIKMNNTALPGMAKGAFFMFSMDEMSAFFQTSLRESYEFFISFFSYIERLEFFFAFIFCNLLLYFSLKSKKVIEDYSLFVTFIVVTTATVLYSLYKPFATPFQQIISVKEQYEAIIQDFKYQLDTRKELVPMEATKKNIGELYILVIGESSNKRHWNAWGYIRNTTPWVTSLRNTPRSIFLENAYSSYCHTIPSLTKALTGANQYNGMSDACAPSIIETAQAAGFKVVWLSNQDQYTLADNPLSVIAHGADTTVFSNKGRFSSDAALLPLLDEILASLNPQDNNLIILHTMGSHFDYSKRIPENMHYTFPRAEEYLGNWARMPSFLDKVLDPYDSTIRYTDTFLEEVYARIKKMPNKIKMMGYFSDHGEDVFGQKFHNSGAFNFSMVRIPAFFVFSQGYETRYANKIATLKDNSYKPFTADTYYDLFIDLMDIETNDLQLEYSIASPFYSLNWDNAITMSSDSTLKKQFYAPSFAIKLSEDPLIIAQKNLNLYKAMGNKIIAAIHCDALGAAKQVLSEGFRAFEINLSAPELYIGHAPQLIYDMKLEEYLSYINLNDVDLLWIDMKSLEEDDIPEVLEKMNFLDEKYHIKDKVILENTLISPRMACFADAGWQTCFYMFIKRYEGDDNRGFSNSYLEIIKKMKPEDDEQLRNFAQYLAENIILQKAKSLSFWGDAYPFVKQYLEPLLPVDIKYNTFAIAGTAAVSEPNMKLFIEHEIMQDPRVATILLPGYTDFGISDPSSGPQ